MAAARKRLFLQLADKADWLNHYDPQGAGVFVPGSDPPAVNDAVRIDLRIEGGPRLLLAGTVLWRRTEGDEKIPPGAGIAIDSTDGEKINYLNGYVRGGLLDLRELRRLPMRLPAKFESPTGVRQGHTRDINEEGLFIVTPQPLLVGDRTTIILTAPTGGGTSVLTAHVTYVMDEDDGGPGMGFKLEFSDGELYARHVERVHEWEKALIEGNLPDEALG